MAKTIDLRTLPEDVLNKKVSDLFPLLDETIKIREKKAIELFNFINENKDSYFKIVIDNINENSVYIGKINLENSVFSTSSLFVEGYGHYFRNNNNVVQSTYFYCSLENAEISVLSEYEYQEITNKINLLLLLADELKDKIFDLHKNSNLIISPSEFEVKRPNVDDYFKINCTKSFVKRNQNKTFSELYKKASLKIQKENEKYEAIYEKGKKLIGRYFIAKSCIGEIIQVEGENPIKIVCSTFTINKQMITFIPKREMWFEAHEITYNDFHMVLEVLLKVKQLRDELKK